MALQMRYDLPSSLARILVLLAENKVVTTHMIEHEHKITKDAKVAIHRLRRRMEGTPGIEIKSRRDVGYWMDAEVRETIRQAMVPDQMSLPFDGEGKGGAAVAA